ncbi:MAG: hypothetical protein HY059_22965 [Proteobacteria bacterium]|nr:hypothetical protein [Pseudomonadota bacterium]
MRSRIALIVLPWLAFAAFQYGRYRLNGSVPLSNAPGIQAPLVYDFAGAAAEESTEAAWAALIRERESSRGREPLRDALASRPAPAAAARPTAAAMMRGSFVLMHSAASGHATSAASARVAAETAPDRSATRKSARVRRFDAEAERSIRADGLIAPKRTGGANGADRRPPPPKIGASGSAGAPELAVDSETLGMKDDVLMLEEKRVLDTYMLHLKKNPAARQFQKDWYADPELAALTAEYYKTHDLGAFFRGAVRTPGFRKIALKGAVTPGLYSLMSDIIGGVSPEAAKSYLGFLRQDENVGGFVSRVDQAAHAATGQSPLDALMPDHDGHGGR